MHKVTACNGTYPHNISHNVPNGLCCNFMRFKYTCTHYCICYVSNGTCGPSTSKCKLVVVFYVLYGTCCITFVLRQIVPVLYVAKETSWSSLRSKSKMLFFSTYHVNKSLLAKCKWYILLIYKSFSYALFSVNALLKSLRSRSSCVISFFPFYVVLFPCIFSFTFVLCTYICKL